MSWKDIFRIKREYPPILPGMRDWPVVQLAKNRKEFIDEVVTDAFKRIKDLNPNRAQLVEELEVTMYRERLRAKRNPWRVDPKDDLSFWDDVRSRMANRAPDEDPEDTSLEDEILREVLTRYANEIAGNFKPSSYRLARRVVTVGLTRLLNAFNVKGFGAIFSNQLRLRDKLEIHGEIDQLRKLAKLGTIVMVPTHFSNLDSVLIGWVIHYLGLPPFIYGAGLNLFNIKIFAYFMNSLGAYKVDRRKKNLLYLECLKTYSTLAIQKGCHSLFFPGGTRSRSGQLEDRLKLGLLSTTIEAQRLAYQKAREGEPATKVFVVPVTINYHFTLEAPTLIREYLKNKGQERFYVENDEFSTSYKIIKFLLKFISKGSGLSVSIGRGMDLFGNYVNDEGQSISPKGNIINTRDYFISNGQVTHDPQRENEYTRRLASVIVEEYHKINRVLSSHLVSFVAFEMLRKKFRKLDLFNLLRIPEEDQVIDYEEFRDTCAHMLATLKAMQMEGKVNLAPHMYEPVDDVIKHGLKNVGMYHVKRPLVKTRSKDITTQDMTVLYYYRNRLDGYGLEKSI